MFSVGSYCIDDQLSSRMCLLFLVYTVTTISQQTLHTQFLKNTTWSSLFRLTYLT